MATPPGIDSSSFENAIIQTVNGFQNYAMVELIFDWLASLPDPQDALNKLIEDWKERQEDLYTKTAKALLERTGVLQPDDRPIYLAIMAESERRIRERVGENVQKRVDGLWRSDTKDSAGGEDGSKPS